MPTTQPSYEPAESITLSWPVDSPSLELTLRNPELNNSESLNFTRRESAIKGGELSIDNEVTGVVYEKLMYTFEALSATDKNNFLAFINATVGKHVKLVDYLSREFHGVITSPQPIITCEGPGCQYTAELTFEGELQ